MNGLDRVSRKYTLLINVDKTKVMASDGITAETNIICAIFHSLVRHERKMVLGSKMTP